jgi:Rieske Fe-S protein
MDRRDFIKVCGASATAIAAGIQSPPAYSGTAKEFAKAKLVDENGQPLKAGSLSQAEAYVFNYPYAGTPCFLISLPSEAKGGTALKSYSGEEYTVSGGVGPNKNIVGYLAVCTHQFVHPDKNVSVIGYSAGNSETAGRAAVITCCAHNSVFDPAEGGKKIGGPATFPLAAVRLEHDAASDELYATGIYGAELIDDFFKRFKSKLNKDYGIGKYREETTGTAKTVLLSKYSAEADSC